MEKLIEDICVSEINSGTPPGIWPIGEIPAEKMRLWPRFCDRLVRYGRAFAPPIFKRSPPLFSVINTSKFRGQIG